MKKNRTKRNNLMVVEAKKRPGSTLKLRNAAPAGPEKKTAFFFLG